MSTRQFLSHEHQNLSMAENSDNHCSKDGISPMARELLARADHAIQNLHLRRASNHAAEDLYQQVPANGTCDCGVPLAHGAMPCWSTYGSAWRASSLLDDLRKVEAFHRVPGSGEATSNLFDQVSMSQGAIAQKLIVTIAQPRAGHCCLYGRASSKNHVRP